MKIIPTPVVQKLSAAESPPVAGGASQAKSGGADQARQASFPAALAQANQKTSPSKTLPNGNDQSGNPTLPSLPTKEDAGASISHGEGIEESLAPIFSPLNLQPVGVEGIPLSVDNSVILASASNVQTNSTAVMFSPLVVSSETSSLVDGESGSVNTNPSASQATSLPSVKGVNLGENQPHTLPNTSQPSVSIPGQIRPEVLIGTSSEPEAPPLILPREQSLPLQSGNRVPLPNVPLSFVNGGFQQGQVVIDPVNAPQLSQAIAQHIQGPFTPSSGISTVTMQDAIANSHISSAGLGEGETSGDDFGSGGQQENAGAFANKQQASGQSFGGFSISTELGSDFRIGESSSSVRTEAMVDRSRMMNLLSSQRLQMEVMLSEDTKVQVDVAVTQQQVSAQLMTDQMMLRNLALQHEPQLEAQLASAGLELKQFGAEVSEHGLFGQHLSDSSSQESSGRGGSEAPELPNSDILVGVGAEADGRFHFVA
jgi:hypothetical protein